MKLTVDRKTEAFIKGIRTNILLLIEDALHNTYIMQIGNDGNNVWDLYGYQVLDERTDHSYYGKKTCWGLQASSGNHLRILITKEVANGNIARIETVTKLKNINKDRRFAS